MSYQRDGRMGFGPWTRWVVLVVVVLSALACGTSQEAGKGIASNGVIDLSGEWELAKEEEVASASTGPGWNVAPGAGSAQPDVGWRPVRLPATWKELNLASFDGRLFLRRSIRLESTWRAAAKEGRLAILLDAARFGSYELFAGTERLGTLAVEGASVPSPRPMTFGVPVEAINADGTLSLILSFDRVAWAYGGSGQILGPVGSQVTLGEIAQLQRQEKLLNLRQRQHGTLPLALIAIAALIGLYHFALAFRQRLLGSDFYFGCITWVGWLFVFVNERGEMIFSTHDHMRRVLVILSHLILILVIELIWKLIEKPFPRWLRLYQVSHLAIVLLAFWVSAAWLSKSLPWRLGWIFPLTFYLALLLWRWAQRSPAVERLWAWTVLALPICLFIDLILQSYGFDGRFLASTLAVAVVGAASTMSDSERFHRVHRDLEQLSQHLEIEVDDQTEELASTNRRLQSRIAERHLVEEALRMLERAVEQSADGIAVTDLSGSTKFINEAWARMHGHDVYDVLGYEFGLFHTTEQMQEEVFPLMTQVRQHGSFQGEVGHRRKDGSIFPAWMSVTRLQSEDGEAMGMVAIARDITEQREAAQEQLKLEKEAQQAEKLESLAILASGIAHDFNNLLTSILGHASLLARKLPAGMTEHDRVRQIEAAADRAAQLSDELLSYAGEDQMAPVVQPLNEVIESLEGSLKELMPPGATLQFQLKRDLPLARLDSDQIHHVLLQLARNGVEALGGSPGVVTVRTSQVEASASYFEGAFCDSGRPPGTYVFFEVSDSGQGIAPEVLVHLFDPFFTTKSGGRGLGLASSLGIVRAHGGAFKVYSQVERGSTFAALFPAASEEESGTVDEREVRSWQGGGTVLVVDDEELVREVAKDILEAQGFEVLTAEDGRQAVRLFRRRRFDIRAVLLDLTMPQMDGEQAFRAMKMAEPNARIFLMSGYSKQQVRQRLEGEGIDGFLHKPFRPEELLRLLREVLDPPALKDDGAD